MERIDWLNFDVGFVMFRKGIVEIKGGLTVDHLEVGGPFQYPRCCALCPFGLTCQRFDMVWDARDLVGLNKLHFLVY